MHFIGYQREGEEEEFCEDIARTGPTVIALPQYPRIFVTWRSECAS